MKIRKATLKDAKTIQKLNQDLFEDNFKYDKTLDLNWPKKNLNYYKKSINGKNSLALIAEEDGKIVGYQIGSISEIEDYRKKMKVAEADNMFILEEFRGKGIGSALLKEFERWAKENGAKMLKLSVYCTNIKAIGAYEKNGFVDYCKTMEKNI